MKLIIAGSRTFTDYKKLCQICDNILQDQTNIEIVSGAYYKGADKLGEQYAKAAGSKRNQKMANYADTLIAFWDGKSRGLNIYIHQIISSNI